MKMNFLKENKNALYIALCVLAFALITLLYFSPIIQGKRLKQHDIEMYKGMSQEIVDFKAQTGEQSLWTNSMFGGMPAWNIGVPQTSNLMTYVNRVLNAGFPHPLGAVFISMLGFFILLLVLDCKIWVSFIGALAYGFTSYLYIVLGAGHNSKAVAMAYMAPVIAGILLTYKGKYLWGAVLTAIALALEVRAGHLQITYYLLLIVICIVIAELIEAVKEKRYIHFVKASGILLGVAALAVLTCTTTLYANYEFGKETMRGKPVLKQNADIQTKGLDRDYITQWSYGIGETWSLMIPNAKGGASEYIGNSNPALEHCDSRFRSTIAQQNAYWGDQPGTSGPVYVGAIVCFLFVLGLFVVKGKYKWVLLAATVLSVLLSWGKNFMGFTDFFIDYFPGYNKFRAVSMTLVMAEVCMPLLAFLALAEIFKNPDLLRQNKRYLYISLGITGGLCLLFYVMPQAFFNFLSQSEAAQFKQLQAGQDGALYTAFANELESVRVAIFKKDAIRSFLYISVSAIVILLGVSGKMNKKYMFASLALLVVLDMYTIDKRYLGDGNFIDKRKADKPFAMSDIDKQILQDKELDYRVINLATNTFNDASTSYFHKSVGGYHGAKLRRYQDIISRYLSKSDNNYWKVLNMLNTRYIIYQKDGKKLVSRNYDAFGNAWLVSDIKWVTTPNEEIDAIAATDVRNVAIVNEEFRNLVGGFNATLAEGAIQLLEYKPNELKYGFDSSKDELVVFSEIWTSKGWTMWIDGVESPLLRADYILRSAIIPAGQHEIVMRYEPRIWKIGNTIQLITSLLLLIGLAVAVYFSTKKCAES
ncbi:MAG: YfhO family protein [Bacteroidales bacterium]|nr:YfhO family protein [Bacteroidales bacterium]MBR4138165.1 YfhO family protein [Bacteroidales bacterium]